MLASSWLAVIQRRMIEVASLAIIFVGFFLATDQGELTKNLSLGFELVFLLAFLSQALRLGIDRRAYGLFWIFSLYLASQLTIFFLNKDADKSLYFTIQSLKVFYYLLAAAWFVRWRAFSYTHLDSIFRFLVGMLFIKYLVSRFFFGIDRPVLVVENNYELQGALLIYAALLIKGRVDFYLRAILWATIILSGSRSAMAGLLFVELVDGLKWIKKADWRVFLYVLVGSLLLIAVYSVFASRLDGKDLESIDRVRFFRIFVDEIENWSLFEYFFGAELGRPLSNYACSILTFYSGFFDQEKGTCYSSIFHAFNMRIIYDHGFFWALVVFSAVFYYVRLAGGSRKAAFLLTGILLLNGMSVSSVNNVYFALPFIIILSVLNNEREGLHGKI